MKTTLHWQHYKYFPYERELALREVQNVLRQAPFSVNGTVELAGHQREENLRRLTYFSRASVPGLGDILPDQARLETGTAKRQSTRYSAHGWHEYKGKFNPQVVRAIGNILGARPGSLLLDPFCGSGTSLVEAAHCGWDAIGLDLNPMAVRIANAKVSALQAPRGALLRSLEKVAETLARRPEVEARHKNDAYLRQWFPARTLSELKATLEAINTAVQPSLRNAFEVLLSDVVRDVSWQEPADLRIRRRRDQADYYPVHDLFLANARERVTAVEHAKDILKEIAGKQLAERVDTRTCTPTRLQLMKELRRQKADLALTSPPYVTALPYVDIHRLSLCLLGEIGHKDIMPTEKALIGNREISTKQRRAGVERLIANKEQLPESVASLCRTMDEAVRGSSDGFRRQNVPALTYDYFASMQRCVGQVRKMVRKHGAFALIVGPTRTTLGGQEFRVHTGALLSDIGEAAGWKVEELTSLDAFQRFSIHHKNAIREEHLLVLRNS